MLIFVSSVSNASAKKAGELHPIWAVSKLHYGAPVAVPEIPVGVYY